jgi:hypothetical protein
MLLAETPLAARAIAQALQGAHNIESLPRARQSAIPVAVTLVRDETRAAVVMADPLGGTGDLTVVIEHAATHIRQLRLADLAHDAIEWYQLTQQLRGVVGVFPAALERVTFTYGLGRYARPCWTPVALTPEVQAA